MKYLISLGVIAILGFAHLINWLITKGTIFCMYNLFDINWYDKFWAVYVLILIVSGIVKSINYNSKS